MNTEREVTRRNFLKSTAILTSSLLLPLNAYSKNIKDKFYEQKRVGLLERYYDERIENPDYEESELKGGGKVGGKYREINFESSIIVEGIPNEEGEVARENKVLFKYYAVDEEKYGDEKKPPIIIIPALNTETLFETGAAPYFCRNGYPVIISNVQTNFIQSMGDFFESLTKETEDIDYAIGISNKLYEQSLLNNMQIIDFITQKRELDETKIKGYAASLGAVQMASWAGIDDRLNTLVLAMVGCNIPRIISHSTLQILAELRDAKLEEIGKDKKWLEDMFKDDLDRSKVIWDPIHHAHHINPENVYMILAKKDKTIPFETGLELAAKINNGSEILEPIIKENESHLFAIWRDLKGHRRDALRFFTEG